jgi:hypothetical protein
MDTIHLNPARLYNCDKTGITVLKHKHTKLVELRGKRQIYSVQSAERGSLVTVVTCMNPTGHFIPPLLAFPRKNMKQELMNGTPLGAIYVVRFPSLGVDTERENFQWFLNFIKHTMPTKENHVYLST